MNEGLREKFMSYLLKRTVTGKQAMEFLERQKASDDDIAVLMDEAEGMGLVDDVAFARLFVDGHRTWGNLKISHELGMRGISRADISAALEEAESEEERAEELAEAWRSAGLEERKIAARLVSRGFSQRAVRSAEKNS